MGFTDIAFKDIVAFSNLSSTFEIKVEIYSYCINGGILGTPKSWIKKLKTKISSNNTNKPSAAKVANFDLLAAINLTVDDANDAVDCHDLQKSSSVSTIREENLPELFGQICCRLAVSPYCRHDPVTSGILSVTWPESDIVVPSCYARLMNWKLEIWTNKTEFNRGELPWKVVRINNMSLLREMGRKFCVENELEEEHIDFNCVSKEENGKWISEILNHIDDYTRWNNAAIDQMEVLSPNIKKEIGGKGLKRKTKSKLMMLYDRISSVDLYNLQGMNLERNDMIVRGSMRQP